MFPEDPKAKYLNQVSHKNLPLATSSLWFDGIIIEKQTTGTH